MTGFLGIVCGLKSEAAVVRAALSDAEAPPDIFRIGISGANAARAAALAKDLCEAGARALVSAGVSGAIDPQLAPGDIVEAQTTLLMDGTAYSAGQGLGAPTPQQGARLGALLGVDEVISTLAEKTALFESSRATAVDMETHSVARIANRFAVPYFAVRAIADPANRALPRSALSAIAPDGGVRVLPVLLSAARRPAEMAQLIELGGDQKKALAALGVYLGPFFRRLLLRLDLL